MGVESCSNLNVGDVSSKGQVTGTVGQHDLRNTVSFIQIIIQSVQVKCYLMHITHQYNEMAHE